MESESHEESSEEMLRQFSPVLTRNLPSTRQCQVLEIRSAFTLKQNYKRNVCFLQI